MNQDAPDKRILIPVGGSGITAPENTPGFQDASADETRTEMPAPKQEKKSYYPWQLGYYGQTRGERAFNILDWFGIGLGANSLISIYAVDAGKHTWMKPWHIRSSAKMANWPLLRKRAERFDYTHEVPALDAFIGKMHTEFPSLTQVPNNKELYDVWYDFAKKENLANHTQKIENVIHELKKDSPAFVEYFKKHESSAKPFIEHLCESSAKWVHSRAKGGWMLSFFLLGSGGFLLMAPIKWLEDVKVNLVGFFDAHFGKKNQTEEEKKQVEARHEELKQEPPQTWLSVLSARCIGYALIVAIYFLTAPKDNWLGRLGFKSFLEKGKDFEGMDVYAGKAAEKVTAAMRDESRVGSFIRKFTSAIERRLSVAPEGWTKAFRAKDPEIKGSAKLFGDPVSGAARHTTIQAVTYTEAIYTTIMAMMTFIFSRFTAVFFNGKKHGEEAIAPALHVTPVPPEPVLGFAAAPPHATARDDKDRPQTRIKSGAQAEITTAVSPPQTPELRV